MNGHQHRSNINSNVPMRAPPKTKKPKNRTFLPNKPHGGKPVISTQQQYHQPNAYQPQPQSFQSHPHQVAPHRNQYPPKSQPNNRKRGNSNFHITPKNKRPSNATNAFNEYSRKPLP